MHTEKQSGFEERLSRLGFGKRFTLAAKFNILTISLVLITSAGACIFMIRMEMTQSYQELLNHGKTIADTTARNCELGIYTENRELLFPVLEALASDSVIAYVSVINRHHAILASRVFQGTDGLFPKHSIPILDNSPLPQRTDFVDEESDLKFSRTVADPIRHADFIDEKNGIRYTEILCPLMSGEDRNISSSPFKDDQSSSVEPVVIGYVRLGLTHEGLQKRIRQMLFSLAIFTSVLVLLGIAFTFFLTRKITSPLKRLREATQDIAEGKFDTPFKIRTSDEISDLAGSFDHMRDRLQAYRAQIEERLAVEQRHLLEKEKLMMDLHDGIGGITTNISILSALAQQSTDLDHIKRTLCTISKLSDEGVSEIRSFMQSLDSKELTWHSLGVEIRKQGSALAEPHSLSFTAEITIENPADQPGSLLWLNLFRIYKESLTNVIKHSRASSVSVRLYVTTNSLFLSVRDNGLGCAKIPHPGRGLPNMEKRAREIGGALQVSGSGEGTLVNLEIPLPLVYTIQDREE